MVSYIASSVKGFFVLSHHRQKGYRLLPENEYPSDHRQSRKPSLDSSDILDEDHSQALPAVPPAVALVSSPAELLEIPPSEYVLQYDR